jgi:hypothetical protein
MSIVNDSKMDIWVLLYRSRYTQNRYMPL